MAKFFIHRPIFAIVIAIVIVIAGGLSIATLPIAQFPNITPPTVQVSVNYPGADAETVEQSIAIPIEQQVNGAEKMLYMSSTSTSDGRYNLIVTFDISMDPDMANVDVNNRVSKATSQLPAVAVQQGIMVTKQSSSMLMVISIYSPGNIYDNVFLSNYATLQMINPITRSQGVGNTSVVGERDYSMRLWVDPEKLAKLGISANDIKDVVNEQNILAPGGSVGAEPAPEGTKFQYTVNANGRLVTEEQFSNIIVRTLPDGSMLRMKDIARVELAGQSYTSFAKLDQNPATIILVYQLPGANAIKTVDILKKLLKDDLGKAMPPGITYEVTLDTTKFVKTSIKEVVKTLFEAIGLVILIVLLFLGSFWATLIPMFAVPVSLIGTFAAFNIFGFSINTLTLFAMVLAVGLVVDDAIVVVEAVEHNIELGMTPLQATERAMDEVSGPVIAIALVLCAVFIPVAFMGGITGELYKQFALTLSISVVISAVMALTLTPALCRMFLKPREELNDRFSVFTRPFFGGFNKIFARVTDGYTKTVKLILRRGAFFLIFLLVIWFLTGLFFKILPTGFLPNEDMGYFFISVTLPDGSSLQRTEDFCDKAVKDIKQISGIKRVSTLGGLNIMNSTYNSNTGSIVCILEDWDQRKDKDLGIGSITRKVRIALNKYPEAMALVVEPPPIMGLGNAGGFQFELEDRQAHTTDDLDKMVRQVIGSAREKKDLTGLYTGYRTTVPQLIFELDRDKAKKLGLPISEIYQSLQIFLGGLPVNQFIVFDRLYYVMVMAEEQYRNDAESVGKLYIKNTTGDMVPINTIAKVKLESGPTLIQRFNLYRTAEINGSAAPGYSSGQAMKTMEEIAGKLPTGWDFEWTGTAFQEKLAGSTQSFILLLSLIFVFLFLAAQYESWSIPFSILFGLPIGIMGALLGVFISRLDNNVYTQIGIVMILGLAAKNAILIVEFAKDRYEKEGMTLFDATVDGAKVRLRPILMTSFAFILGVVPLVIATGAGAASRNSLGTAVFSGMLTATSLGIFFIPLLYFLLEILTEKIKRKPVINSPEINKSEPVKGGVIDAEKKQ